MGNNIDKLNAVITKVVALSETPDSLFDEFPSELVDVGTDKRFSAGFQGNISGAIRIENETIRAIHPKAIESLLLSGCQLQGLLLGDTTIRKCLWITPRLERNGNCLENMTLSVFPWFLSGGKKKEKPEYYSINSIASGLCIDKMVVKAAASVVFVNTDLTSMMARQLQLNGAFALDGCRLDGVAIVDYRIYKGGSLCMQRSRAKESRAKGKMIDSLFAAANPVEGKLVLKNLDFERVKFNQPGKKCYFQPSKLEDVIFKDCDFSAVEISVRHETENPEEWDWQFNNCDLRESLFKGVKGRLTIDGGNVKSRLTDCWLSPNITNFKNLLQLECSNVILRNPQAQGTKISALDDKPWGKFCLAIDSKISNLSGCEFHNLDLSKADFKIIASGDGTLDLNGAKFYRCRLTGINFSTCNLDHCEFHNCNLDACVLPGAKALVISGGESSLRQLRFSGEMTKLKLDGLDSGQISSMNCSGTAFNNCDFIDIQFTEWNAFEAKFVACKFTNCSFNECQLGKTSFLGDSSKAPCLFFAVDFTRQQLLDGIDFESVEADKSCTFCDIRFESCLIKCTELFDNNANFAGSAWSHCQFADKLPLKNFPFNKIGGIFSAIITNSNISDVEIKASLHSLHFESCLMHGVKFCSEAKLENVEISSVKKVSLVFAGCKINALEIKGRHEHPIQMLEFNGAKIKKLTIAGIHAEQILFKNCNKINELKIRESEFNCLRIQHCHITKGGLAFTAGSEQNNEVFIEDCKFSPNVVFSKTMIQGAKIKDTNLFELPGSNFNDVNFAECQFEKLPFSGEFPASLKIKDCGFIACNFKGAILSGTTLQKCEFDPRCDFSCVANGKISDVDLSGTTLSGKLDGVCLKNCLLFGAVVAGTNADSLRELRGVCFDACAFDKETIFSNLKFIGTDQHPCPLMYSESLQKLQLHNIVFESTQLCSLDFAGNHEVEFLGCRLEKIKFSDGSLKLSFRKKCRIGSIYFSNITFDNTTGATIPNLSLTESCQIENAIFDICSIGRAEFYECAFKDISFISWEKLENILFNQCSFMRKIAFKIPDCPESGAVAKNLDFNSCYIPSIPLGTKADKDGYYPSIFEFNGELGENRSIDKFEIKYISENSFSQRMNRELQSLGLPIGAHIATEWKLALPFRDRVADIRSLIEDGETGQARHLKFPRDNEDIRRGFEKFQKQIILRGGEIISENTLKKLKKLTQKLIDMTEGEAPCAPKEFWTLRNEWEENLLVRLSVDRDLAEHPDFKTWVIQLFDGKEYEILDWPDNTATGKIYMDFLLFKDLLANRIVGNIIKHGGGRSIIVANAVGSEDCVKLFLAVGDFGTGFDVAKLSNNNELGKKLMDFCGRYTSSAWVKSVHSECEKVFRIDSFGLSPESSPDSVLTPILSRFNHGTVYVFQFQLW